MIHVQTGKFGSDSDLSKAKANADWTVLHNFQISFLDTYL